MRIAIGGISHETTTFVETRTTLADFEHGFGLYRGSQIIDRFRGANICTGGFLAGAEEHGFDDLEAVEKAHAAGVGQELRLALGGKSDPRQGPPVDVEAQVAALTEGGFHYDGPMYAGLSGNLGRSAWLRIGGVSVVVVSKREQPLDPAFARSLGIDCAAMRYIALKSAVHFRSGFERLAGSIQNVDAAGILVHDFTKLPYRKRRRPLYPLERA